VARPTDDSREAIALALKAMYDLYGLCAGRFVDSIDYPIRERHE
jgi:hypothetical protein